MTGMEPDVRSDALERTMSKGHVTLVQVHVWP